MLGYGSSQEGPVFSWVDPDNVELNGSLLSQWNKTVLVRKIGSYPNNHQDGEIIATTSYDLQNKNYYKTHNFVDTTQEEGNTYYYKLFSQSKFGVWNNLIQNEFTNGLELNWYQIQSHVRAGRGPELFPVGTVFYVDHPQYTHQDGSGIIFRVAGHDQIPTTNQSLTHSMCLEMVECLFIAPYDSPQDLYALTQDETAQINKTYYTYDNAVYTALVQGTDYQIGDNIPVASWYQKNIDLRASYGSNNSIQSNLMQWANSDGNAKQWFTKQTIWDKCTSVLYDKNGFLKYLDQDFLNVVQEAKLIRLCDRTEIKTFSVKFFLLSQSNLNGNYNNNLLQNQYLTYYKNNNSNLKFLMDNEIYISWWLSSASPYHDDVGYWVAGNDQSLYELSRVTYYSGTTSNPKGVSLACIIA